MTEMAQLADDLVDPTAQRTEQRERAPRLAPSNAVTVGLVDGTLNKASLWGQGMLDAAERALSPALTAATFDRISLNPLKNPPPDLWVASVLSDHGAVVFVAGDCITCTSRSVRDAIWSEFAGIPAAMICTGSMREVVQQVCDTYGMASLPCYPIDESFFGCTQVEIAERTTSGLAGFAEHFLQEHA